MLVGDCQGKATAKSTGIFILLSIEREQPMKQFFLTPWRLERQIVMDTPGLPDSRCGT